MSRGVRAVQVVDEGPIGQDRLAVTEGASIGWRCSGVAQEAWRLELRTGQQVVHDTGWVREPDTIRGVLPDGLVADRWYDYRTSVSATCPGGPVTAETGWQRLRTAPAGSRTPWIRARVPGRGTARLHRAVTLPPGHGRVLLRWSALGTAAWWVNGRQARQELGILGPGFTDYRRAAPLRTVDISALATTDQLVLDVELGHGFFDMATPNAWLWHEAPWRDRPALWCEVLVEVDGGEQLLLRSDRSWKATTGTTTFDCLYAGESVDETLAGEPLDLEEVPGPVLRPRVAPPVTEAEPVELDWQPSGDGWLAGLDAVVAGGAEVTSRDGLPHRVRLVHGEELRDGRAFCDNRFVYSDRFQVDKVTTAGTWRARHSYKGFRYLTLTGADPTSQVRVRAVPASAAWRPSSRLQTSEPTLAWLDDAWRQSVRNNIHFFPTDSPTFEKNGWTGDALTSLPALLDSFWLLEHLTSWLDDFRDSQQPDGQLPVIIPSGGWGLDGECAPAPEWTTCYPMLVAALAEEYQMDWLWRRHGDAALAYLRWELRRLDGDGLAVGRLGDYLSPGTAGPPPEDIRLVSSVLLVEALRTVAAALPEHAGELEPAADELATAVNRVFLDEAAGCYRSWPEGEHPEVGYRQSQNVVPLSAGIVPEHLAGRVLASVLDDLTAHDGHHDTGCITLPRMLRLLTRTGHHDVALRVATQQTAPGWGAWRLAGHRSLLERWDEPVRSFTHYFMGAGVAWLYQDVAGLQRTAPGWRTARITPRPSDEVDRLELVRETVRGTYRVSWEPVPDGHRMSVTVPWGCTAQLMRPDGTVLDLGPGDHREVWPRPARPS